MKSGKSSGPNSPPSSTTKPETRYVPEMLTDSEIEQLKQSEKEADAYYREQRKSRMLTEAEIEELKRSEKEAAAFYKERRELT